MDDAGVILAQVASLRAGSDWTLDASVAKMARQMPRLHRKARLILDIVRDHGDPDALEIIRRYHRESGEPLEPANVVRILQDLVREGALRAERRPAPAHAPFEEMVHFLAVQDPVGDSPVEHATPPVHTAQLLEIVRFVLRESPELKLAARVSERSESA